MEALNKKFDILEERLEELDVENKQLKKEVASLKRQNIDYGEEISGLKSQLSSLDRTFRKVSVEKESQASSSHNEECAKDRADMRKEMERQRKKVDKFPKPLSHPGPVAQTGQETRIAELEKKVESTVNLQKMLNRIHVNMQTTGELEKQISELTQRVNSLDELRDIKEKSACLVSMEGSPTVKHGMVFDKYLVKSEFFDKKKCTYKVPKAGHYRIGGYLEQLEDGELELFVRFGDNHWSRLARTDQDGAWALGSSIRYLEKGDIMKMSVECNSGNADIGYCAFEIMLM